MLALTLKAYDEFRPGAPDAFWQQYTTNIAAAVTTGADTQRIVAFIGDKMVGTVLLCNKSMRGNEPEIRLLAIDPSHRRQGIAKKLMTECESRVRNEGHKRVVLHTTNLMQVARKMYEGNGYERFEEIDFRPIPEFLVMGFVKSLRP